MREDKLPNTDIPATYVHTLVIGSGASGLAAAVRLRAEGVADTLLVTEGLDKGTSINALYRTLTGIIGHDVEIIHAPKRPGDIYMSYFDCRKAEVQLGWKAQVDLEAGLARTVDHFKSKQNR